MSDEAATAVLRRRLDQSKEYYLSGETRSLAFRKRQLQRLSEAIRLREEAILEALAADLGKCEFESFTSEIALLYDEIKFVRRRLGRWARPRRVSTPLVHFPSSSRVIPEPLGVALILSPWNYPFMLAVAPLIGAIAAGCTAILKPSEHAPATSAVLRELVTATFEPAYLDVVEGNGDIASALVSMPFDTIFFTGSTTVGKKVMAGAAQNLTPVILELGGKSPAIVNSDANLTVAAKRITWGKYMNAGQTCVAPDFVYVHEAVAEDFVAELREAVQQFYGEEPRRSPDYARIINQAHFDRLASLLEAARAQPNSELIYGGVHDREERYIAPTAIRLPGWETSLMEEEIFGPILPVISYSSLTVAISELQARPRPLALYLFSSSKEAEERVVGSLSFGGGSINDTVLHVANPKLPFGGVGKSGLGNYHGKASFDAFTHEKSILSHATWLDIPMKYPPYSKKALNLIKRLMG
ncbi:MAG: aldehyde dehydrogenase [Spirochaetaceae bacterium]